MAVEYEARFEQLDIPKTLHSLTDTIGGSESYALTNQMENKLLLQMTAIHERGLWKDDIGIVLDPQRMHIIFHNGNRTQRLEFLALVQKSLLSLNIQENFVEIQR